jgi:3-oxoacyl-[acyl-carrier-protein] synthase II
MGTVNPLGKTLDDFWTGLIEGRSTARTIDHFDTSRVTTKFASLVPDFDPQEYLERKLVSRNGRVTHLAVASATLALADSGLNLDQVDRRRVGVELGTGIGAFLEFYEGSAGFAAGGRVSSFFAPMIIPNMAAGQIAINLGLTGPNSTTCTACAASTQAIGNAARVVERGDADVILACGSEGDTGIMGLAGFGAVRALSTRNQDPATASRPFDAERDGFVIGEGSATLVLESLEHALKRDARIHGEVIGFARTDDAFHAVAPHESGEAASRCITLALADAGIEAQEIDYVNAHGTSTGLNDAAETKALKMALGDHAYKIPISSTKSMIGHLLGGAGAVEAVATLLSMKHGMVHPTINYQTPDPACDLDYVPNVARVHEVRTAISNGFGFAGQNAVLVLRRFEA